jgi:pimeloyl-ACP methyl ester carboxylesterase
VRPLFFAEDENFWFETLRSLGHVAYGGADIGEVVVTAERIKAGDYDSWYAEWTRTAERIAATADRARSGGHDVSARDAYLRASNYFRTAEFFLHGNPADPRILGSYDRAIAAFDAYVELAGGAVERVAIPYEDTTLPGYFYPSPLPGRQPLVIMHNGFDGTAEEMRFFGALAAQERGYHVLCFDGPGQPGTRQRHGLLFRPDWENVVGPVLDYGVSRPEVDADRVSLLGVSLGGQLSFRAAAFEPRLAAVIAVDGVYDFGVFATRFVDGDRDRVKALVNAESAPGVDRQLAEAMETSPTARWAFTHGAYVMGGDTPRACAAKMLEYDLRDGVAERISCPALVCEAGDDLFFGGQPQEVFEHLTTADRTWLRFTEEEGADAHCHIGAQRYAFAAILDWLDERTPVRR